MSKPAPGLKPWRTIQTGPTSDAFRSGWERAFGKPKRKRAAGSKTFRREMGQKLEDTEQEVRDQAAMMLSGSPRAKVEELRAAADRARSGDNASDLEREADAIEAAARASGVWDG